MCLRHVLQQANGSPKGACLMMRRLRDKFVALIMLIVSLFYVGYRIY
jgi:hypothetical protein